jgi:hypothetical protein
MEAEGVHFYLHLVVYGSIKDGAKARLAEHSPLLWQVPVRTSLPNERDSGGADGVVVTSRFFPGIICFVGYVLNR